MPIPIDFVEHAGIWSISAHTDATRELEESVSRGFVRQGSQSAVRIIRPLKTIFDLSFFPILEGCRLEAAAESARASMKFKDWRKNSSLVELIDKTRRERMIFESHRVCVEIDSFLPDHVARHDELKTAMKNACEQLGIEELLRVGLRQYFALSVEGLFEQGIFKKLRDRLFKTEIVEKCIGEIPDDMGIVFETDDRELWHKRRIEIGAMAKMEWFGHVKYLDLILETKELTETKWISGLVKALPSDFLFIDIDTFWLLKPPNKKPLDKQVDVDNFFKTVEKLNHEVARQFLDLVRR